MLSLQEFGITEPSSNFSLCEVSVAEGGFVKQRTLPDPLQNLAERIGLASRYFLKSKNSSESLLPDDNVNDLGSDFVKKNLSILSDFLSREKTDTKIIWAKSWACHTG